MKNYCFTYIKKTDNFDNFIISFDENGYRVDDADNVSKNVEPAISAEKNIFSDLPDFVFKNEKAREYLIELRKTLLKFDRTNRKLPKLRVGDVSESGFSIEWVFSFFRIYYLFDKTDGETRGIVLYDEDGAGFKNEFKKLKKGELAMYAQWDVMFVLRI